MGPSSSRSTRLPTPSSKAELENPTSSSNTKGWILVNLGWPGLTLIPMTFLLEHVSARIQLCAVTQCRILWKDNIGTSRAMLSSGCVSWVKS